MKSLAYLALATALMAITAAPAVASEPAGDVDENGKIYIAISAGPSWPTLELQGYEVNAQSGRVGAQVAGSLGLQTSWLRWDVADLAYDTSETVSRGISATTSLLSLGTGFRIGPFGSDYLLCPYVSLGLGGGRLSTNAPGEYSEFSEWGFQWNAGLGVEIKAFKSLRIGARYRYRSISIDFVATGRGARNASLDVHTLGIEILL